MLTSSKGNKRLLASLLLGLIEIIKAIGGIAAAPVVLILQALAASLGVVGVGHAAIGNPESLRKQLLATLGALIAVAQLIPALHPFVGLLNQIGLLFGLGALVQKKTG